MANLIQIRRSLSTAIPSSLANGELAFTANGNVLYIGSPNGSIVAIGGYRNPGVLTANQALVANSTGYLDVVKAANLVVTAINANGSYGSNGQVLVTNGTAIYWGTGTSGTNTQVQFNDSGVANGTAGFTFDKTTNTLSISNTITIGSGSLTSTNFSGTANNANNLGGVAASSYATMTYADTGAGTAYSNAVTYAGTISGTAYSNAMSDTLSRNGTYTGNNTFQGTTTTFNSNLNIASANISAVSANFTVNNATITNNLTVSGNTTLGANVVDIINVNGVVTGNVNPSANVTYYLGNSTSRWLEVHAANVHSVRGYFDGDVQISGSLTVSGNVTTTNVQTVIISDPLIYLAGNNYSSDLVDIGFAGNYSPDGGTTQRHTGLFRKASTDQFYLFKNLTQELSNTNVVNIADPSFVLADLNARIISGGLISNSTTVAITANSTVNVAITANTLTLSSPLAGTSGGTGLSSYTNQDILVANSTNGFSKLSLGTAGYVLQSNGSALVYDVLDGGSF